MTKYEILKLYKDEKISLVEAKKRLREEKKVSYSNVIYLKPSWKEEGLDRTLTDNEIERIVVFCSKNEKITIDGCNQIYVYKGEAYQKKNAQEYECDPYDKKQFELLWKEVADQSNHIVYLWNNKQNDLNSTDFLKDSESLFLLLKTVMEQGATRICHIVMPYYNGNPSYAAFGGFAKSLSIENPKVKFHTVSISEQSEISEIIKNEILYFNENETEIKYENKKRFIRELQYIEQIEGSIEEVNYKNKTILITGGAGGLGLIFTKYFAKEGAKEIILTGRSQKLSSNAAFDQIKSYHTNLIYQQLDICDEDSVKEFVEMLEAKNKHIDGIIHSAGVLRDSYMIKKEKKDFLDVLKPKVVGINHLFKYFNEKHLDFFVVFSSIVGVLGNAGQADYATANSYMDNFTQFASKINKKWKRTVSINWPFWENGGMKLSEANLNYMAKQYGLYPISHKEGIRAFNFSIANNEEQVVVVNGNLEILSSYIPCLKEEKKESISEGEQNVQNDTFNEEILKQKVVDLLKNLISDETKMKIERISMQVPIEKYGLDSVMMMSISSKLETIFGSLRKTLLFEYINIDTLSDYFVEDHKESIIRKLLSEDDKNKAVEVPKVDNKEEIFNQNIYDMQPKVCNEADDIAIIGIAGKYPMADDLDELWRNLCVGKDCITSIPEDRWIEPQNSNQWGGFIRDVDKFDPLLFEISHKEAALVDPSERIFMETVWSALENAGYTRRRLSGENVGVFVGAMYAHYQFYGVEEYQSENAKPLNSSLSSIANRISFFFDFHGPSLTVDTMCSSSLTALHLATKCLKDGECKCAIVGGVNLSLHPYKYYILEENNFTSSDGRCRSFGEGGDGYVPGEGSGAIIIKPLKKAIEDNDLIHAVIKGTSINHGGNVGGFTVPSPNMQANVIAKALKESRVNPFTIQYVEAHGTGTHLGDPIEIAGLEKAFAGDSSRKGKCAIGSIKSNIGHLEAAAGIAGITKVILQMEHQKLVPSIHSDKLNKKIDFSSSLFQVQRNLEEWNSMEVENGIWKRRAGVSSFGAGGSNAHVIMEDYSNKMASIVMEKNIVPFSARTQKQLMEHIDRILNFVSKSSDTSGEAFSRFCYTLQQGREQLFCRCAVVCDGFEHMYSLLKEYIENQNIHEGVYIGNTLDYTMNIDVMTNVPHNTKRVEQLYQDKQYNQIAKYWCSGAELDWGFLYKNEKMTPMPLPNLPFEKTCLWIPQNKQETSLYKRTVSNKESIIRDHIIKGVHIVPTAYIIELFYAAAKLTNVKNICINNLKLYQPLIVDAYGENIKITSKTVNSSTSISLKLFSEDGTILYSSCEIKNELQESFREELSDEVDMFTKIYRGKEECYEFFQKRGYQYGETLRLIRTVESTKNRIVAFADTHTLTKGAYITKPELLDAALQTTMLFAENENGMDNYIPVSVDEIIIAKENSDDDFRIVTQMRNSEQYKTFDIDVLSTNQNKHISIRGLKSINADAVKTQEPKKEFRQTVNIGNVKEMISKLISEELGIPIEEITPQIGFEKIGINSIAASGIIARLDEIFGNMPRTLFYETNNINELSQYLIDNYKEILISNNNELSNRLIDGLEAIDLQQFDEKSSADQDIAIIGLSGKYPMADNMEEFWNNLVEGKDCITTIPKERWDLERYFNADKDAQFKHYSKWGSFLDNIDTFDPLFFNIAPSQAAMIDPQERLFLQTAWECLEDAGYTPEELANHKVGVYVGAMWGLYHLFEVEKDGKKQIPQTTFSSIANRVSYCMNFDGPSMAVDTMCSSSITAIHLACEAIKSGEIQEAIAGGVNLSVHPSKYIQLCQGKFLSTDGKCRSFGEGGDGYVPGEGVGAIMLKALPKAIKDHDNIYAVIKASSINHGGHGNGYTVPNVKKQIDILKECVNKAHISIEDISYVEAHGTGTELGDPIEVSSLSKVLTGRAEKCPIGSVKSNIGHLEAAAGIAAVTKVLLQMKYGKLVPSIHSDELNKNIDFRTAPVVVQRTLADWRQNANKTRIAAVDSFGAGGSNGCLIIEEYISPERNVPNQETNEEQVLILSAREQGQLDIYRDKLLDFMKKNQSELISQWNNIIYTLQNGRKPFEYRLAIVCSGYDDMIQKLESNKLGAENSSIFMGYASEKEILKNVEQNDGYDADIRKCANNWANGKYVDWSKLNQTTRRKLSLPVYPFDNDRYYANYPSIDVNISQIKSDNISGKCMFEKTIQRNDAVIAEHVMGGRVILPGTYFIAFAIEMIRKAFPEENVGLRDVNWEEPFEIRDGEQDKTIYIEFNSEGSLDFEIFHIENSKRHTCVTGKITKEITQAQYALDIHALQYEVQNEILDDEMYFYLNEHGYQYGNHYKRTYNISFNGNEAFANVYENNSNQNGTTDYFAELLDACIRTALCINGNLKKSSEPLRIPFYLDEFRIYGNLQKARYAYAYSVDVIKDSNTQKCNVVVADENGVIIALFTNLISRVLRTNKLNDMIYAHRVMEEHQVKFREAYSLSDVIVWNPSGQETGLTRNIGNEIVQNVYDSPENLQEVLREVADRESQIYNFIYFSTCAEALEMFDFERIMKEVQYITNVLKAINSLESNLPIQFVYCGLYQKELNPFISSLQSYLQSFMMVNPEMRFSVVAIKKEKNEWELQSKILCYELEHIQPNRKGIIHYKDGKKWVSTIKPLTLNVDNPLIKENGTYLIAGGCGKIGQMISNYLASKYHAYIILVGRSQANEAIETCLHNIQSLGGNAMYLQGDICDEEQVKQLIQSIMDNHRSLDGVINMAGSTSGKSILEATDSDIRNVLASKIAGTENLDLATRDLPLDFFATFSSISCVMGDFGECSYSMANEYLNQFIVKRERLKEEGKRFGQSISISWPLFGDGKFELPEDKKNIYFKYSGMAALSNEEAIQIFEKSLSLGNEQVMVFYGDKSKIGKILEIKEEVDTMREHSFDLKESTMKKSRYYYEMAQYLKKILSENTGISVSRMKEDEEFQRYGIDSIMIMNMNKVIDKDFTGIIKTIFFEYNNIHDMVEYFVKHHKAQIKEFFHIEDEEEVIQSVQTEQIECFRPKFIETVDSVSSQRFVETERDKMAIIGVSGRFPKADDIDEFWEVLKNGIDCIEEVPEERWPIGRYYSEDKTEEGKTYSRWGGFVKDADKFDSIFFNIAPYQAEKMDPQERIFLETAWSTIEDAGYTRDKLKKNSVGVFVGAMYAHYQMLAEDECMKGNPIAASSYLSSIANRVSYVMDFNGPSATVDTACSSALEAIRLGCLNIQNGDCNMALVGGVNLSLHPQKYIFLSQSNFLASDGRCHSYGDGGDGYVPGEGVGAILIKPLEAAKRDHDHIYAVINSIAANHGGRTSGYTVPNPNAQSAVIKKALTKGGINPETISYIEGHGTGTSLGDPIEVTGLTKAFQDSTLKRNFCALGSAKANIGHLEAAAGIAGVTKILLQMKHKMIPPLAGSNDLNQNINFGETPFYVPRELQEWKRPVVFQNGSKIEAPLRAGINAFGAGGANVHIELEEYVDKEIVSSMQSPCVILLSAKNQARLKEYAKKLSVFVGHNKIKMEYAEEYKESDEIEKQVQQIVSECLNIPCEVVEAEDNLLELGIDRVSIEKIKNSIQKTFNKDVSEEFMKSQISLKALSKVLMDKTVPKRKQEEYTLRLDELAYTLQTGREQMDCRIGFMASSLDEVEEKLKAFAEQDCKSGILYNTVQDNADELELFTDTDGKEILELLIRKQRIEKLLSLWIKGITIDWEMLYQSRGIKKVPLPTYPFERKRYYITITEDEVVTVEKSSKKVKKIENNIELQYTYEADWVLNSKYQLSKNIKWNRVLICYHKSAEKFAKNLGAYHGQADVQYYEFSSGNFVVKTPLKNVERVYFIGDVEFKESTDYDDKNSLSNLQALFSLLKIAYRGNRPDSVCVLSNMVYLVHKDNAVNPFAGGTYGLIHSVEKEYTDISFSYFDLDVYKKGVAYDEAYANRLMPVICGKQEGSLTEHAIRNGYVYSREIYPIVLQEQNSILKENGVYVICGGMGSIGQDLTKYLLSTYHASVAIIGKRDLDEERSQILKEYEKLDGSVSYYQVDMCQSNEARFIFEQIKEKYGKIDGIFNSTMVFRNTSFSELKKEDFEETVRIKIAGNANIMKAVEDMEVGFVMVFSSVQSFNGNSGRAHYSAACDLADQFVRYAAMKQKYPVKIINWGFWGSHNGTVLDEGYVKELNQKGIFPIEPMYGMKMIEKVLENDVRQVLVFQAKQYVLDLMHAKEQKPERIYTDILQYEEKNHFQFEPEILKDIDEFCCVGAIKVLQSLGLFVEKTDTYEKEAMYQTILKHDKYKQLLDAIISIAIKAGYIKGNATTLSATKKISNELKKKISQYDEKIEIACENYKELDGYLKLLKHCVHEMPLVIEEKKSAEEVLFPNSKMDLVEGVYKKNKMSIYLNQMLAVGINSYIEQKIPFLLEGEKINILEIGAGTGSSSEIILENIAQYGKYIRYIYSDVSKAFLLHGKSSFEEKYPFVEYEILDVEQDLLAQNAKAANMDIVFGTNVFHATKSIYNTVSNIRKIMKANGLFMLNEGTQTIDVLTLSFGMLAGWWLFEDKEIRIPHTPLLTSDNWIKALSDCGYTDFLNMESIICARADSKLIEAVETVEVKEQEITKGFMETPKSKDKKEVSVNLIEQEIVKILMEVLKLDLDDIELDRKIMDYGVDSILAVKILSEINETFKVQLTPDILFECGTIEILAEYVKKDK